MSLRWQYQSEVEPLRAISGSGVGFVPKPDAYISTYANPGLPARMLCAAIVAGCLFAPPLIESEIPDIVSYAGNISYTRRLQYQSFAEPILVTLPSSLDVLVDTWFLPDCNQPVLKRPTRFFQEGWSVTVAVETPELYRWDQPTQQPTRPPTNHYYMTDTPLDPGEIAIAETFLLDSPIVLPAFPRRELESYIGWWDIDWYTTLAGTEVVTVDKWFMPIDQPRDCERRQYLYPPGADKDLEPIAPIIVIFPQWYQETCQPVFLRAVPVAEGITLTDPARYYAPGVIGYLLSDPNRLIMDENYV